MGALGSDGSTTPVPAQRGNYPGFYRQLAEATHGREELPVKPFESLEVLSIIEKFTPSPNRRGSPRATDQPTNRKGRRMSSTTSPKRVAIIGGGILGVSTAVHLLRQGASVILLTERGLASEATGRSLSWLNSAGERSAPYHQLRVAGVDRYRTLFAQDTAREWLQFDGGLMWNAAGQHSVTEARHTYEKSIGYDSKLLAPEDIAAVTPGIDAGAVPENAIFNPGEGWVSLPDLVEFLMEEFHARGGRLVLNAGKASVTVNGARATGVETAAGENYEADAVLVACGAATPAVVAPSASRSRTVPLSPCWS